ncbi:MAG: hypothetical protein Q9160_003604 [Pyrenula sp. 1 TL-2023]
MFVAPLQVIKSENTRDSDEKSHEIRSENVKMPSQGSKSASQLTPPSSPQVLQGADSDNGGGPPPVFHNYLRAFYPFHPTGSVSPSTVTLPLNYGDVVLIHSVHTNGWADGTLLEDGSRGWLPTNYCEAYEELPMRHLLKALIDFWEIIRCCSTSSLSVFRNQDYMRGLIAGVRYLLERCDCLTRDTAVVKAHDNIRKARKALLSDLSSLVKVAKLLQDVVGGSSIDQTIEDVFDDMLLKAFKVVTRGVKFLDVWTSEFGCSPIMAEIKSGLEQFKSMQEPLTPPIDPKDQDSQVVTGTGKEVEQQAIGQQPDQSSRRVSKPAQGESQSAIIPSPAPKRNVSASHRTSYGRAPPNVQLSNLASERLGRTYDVFLGVLGSFIGLHLHSRSSTDLLLTTRQAVKCCRELLSIIEVVISRDCYYGEMLHESQNILYDMIRELVSAARDVFKPVNVADEELCFIPEEGQRLVNAATSCVRAAGDCVTRTRLALDRMGDFEVVLADLSTEQVPTSSNDSLSVTDSQSSLQRPAQETAQAEYAKNPIDDARTPKPIAPRLEIPRSVYDTDNATATTSPGSHHCGVPMSALTTSSTSSVSFAPPPIFADALFNPAKPLGLDSALPSPPCQNTVPTDGQNEPEVLNGVPSTLSKRMSGLSQVSTMPTSPETSTFSQEEHSSERHRYSGSQTTLADDMEDTEARLLEKTFAHEMLYNKDGQVIGGTLSALIEKLTGHNSTPDALFLSTFYLTFRLFATPMHFAEALVDRFEYVGQTPSIAGPVRLRVYNVFKTWLESHWRHDCDDVALDFILDFSRISMMKVLPNAGKRIKDLAEKVAQVHGPVVPRLVSNIGKTNTAIASYVKPDTPLPSSIISKGQLTALRNWRQGNAPVSILDFDPLELARQLTLKASSIFGSILPEELLATEWNKRSGSLAVNVRAMSTLSTDLANFVVDSILQQEEPKKRAAIIKQWVKIANKCLDLANYDSLMAIICSLVTSTIIRLKKTWEIVSQKTKTLLENLKAIVDVSRNYVILRQRLQNQVPPCLPFVGTYLTDLTFVDHGNHATRQLSMGEGSIEVINFDKHMKTAKIISELQRFQVPYRLAEVPELQTWIQDQLVRVRSGGDKTHQAHYRKSLILEPKDTRHLMAARPQIPKQETKDRFDFLSRNHLHSKDRSITGHA